MTQARTGVDVLIALRWWIWSIAVAAPIVMWVFVVGTWDLNDETLGEWIFFGAVLIAWGVSAAAGLVTAVVLVLRRRTSRGQRQPWACSSPERLRSSSPEPCCSLGSRRC
jgi:hypothetical protein